MAFVKSEYEGKSRYEKYRIVREKYPEAKINLLLAERALTKGARIFDTVLGLAIRARYLRFVFILAPAIAIGDKATPAQTEGLGGGVFYHMILLFVI